MVRPHDVEAPGCGEGEETKWPRPCALDRRPRAVLGVPHRQAQHTGFFTRTPTIEAQSLAVEVGTT